MFKDSRFVKVFAAGVAALLMVACGGNKGSMSQPAEDSLVPDNAVIALKVDGMSLWNKVLGDPGSQVRNAVNMGKAYVPMLTSDLDSEELSSAVSSIVSDPKALGIDLDKPVFLSADFDILSVYEEEVSGEVYLSFLLNDQDAFISVADAVWNYAKQEQLPNMSREVIADDYAYYVFGSEGGVTIDLGVGGKVGVLRIVYDENASNVDYKKSMLSLYDNGGPARTEGYQAFCDADEDAVLWADVDGLLDKVMPVIKTEEPEAYAQLQSVLPLYNGSSATAAIDFLDGKTVLDLDVYGSAKMKAYASRYYAMASDKYYSYLPATSAVVANIALKDLAGMIDEMASSSPELAELLPMLEEVGVTEKVLKGMPGQIALALDGYGLDAADVPGFVAVVECSQDVWALAEGYLQMYAEQYGDAYVIEDVCKVEYTDGVIVVSEIGLAVRGSYADFGDARYASVIRNGGVAVDLTQFPSDVLYELSSELDMAPYQLLEYVNGLVITTDGPGSTTVTLDMGDKEHNLLEKIAELVVSQAF